MEKTQAVLNIFVELSAVPRGSGREAKISRWIQDRAARQGFACQVDAAGNLLIRVPATPGMESAPPLALQGHMDMVCEKTPASTHDFTTDPIQCVVDGEWMHAVDTTLGADNGIAIALALALAEDPLVKHPALELLFTVEEEVGLGGVNLLQPDFLSARVLINLDSEEEGAFIIGCAGGQTTHLRLPLAFSASGADAAFALSVGGLRGGHSGVDVHRHYANANRLVARALAHIQKTTPINLVSLAGGTAHNAISRAAEAHFMADSTREAAMRQALREIESILRNEYSAAESGLVVTLSPAAPAPALSLLDTARVLHLLQALPHGVAEMSASVEGFVETSNNLARVELDAQGLHIVTSQRSTVMTRLEELTARITAIGVLAGAEVTSSHAYPSWQPDTQSPLLQHSREVYRGLFGSEPSVGMIHGGLECGTIGAIYPGMELISFGATIQNPHSPLERLNIPSVGRLWRFLVQLLQS